MKFLDPIHKYIYFSDEEKKLIDSLAFQRLKNIKQLGFTDRTFIGAVHNRFMHSLGASHLAGEAFNNIFPENSVLNSKKKKAFHKLIRIAALLHDIGHGPFSHSSEPKMPPLEQLKLPGFSDSRKACHEDYSVLLIFNTEISRILESMEVPPKLVAAFFQKNFSEDDFFKSQGVSYFPLLKQILHSEIDVDRMDYLKRDSYFCGAYYGYLDFEWILKNLSYHIENHQAFLAVKSQALYTLEDFLLGHHHMRLMVYWHPKNVIYDEMLLKYFQSPECSFSFPTQAEEYIFCNDFLLYQHLKEDSKINSWAERIICHSPYKSVFQIQYTSNNQKSGEEKAQTVRSLLDKNSIPFISKKSISHIAEAFNKKFEHPIYVIDSYSKKPKSLSKSVRMFSNQERKVSMDRIYVAPQNEKAAQGIIKEEAFFQS